MEIFPGRVLIARGDHHLRYGALVRGASRVWTGDRTRTCRPAADVLFRSLAGTYGRHVLSVVLTGMGRDGFAGTQKVKAAGGVSLAQDETSSVGRGMPGAVVEAGLADRVVPLGEIVPEVFRLISGARSRR